MLHTTNMLALPLLPVIILLIQNLDVTFTVQDSQTIASNIRTQVIIFQKAT